MICTACRRRIIVSHAPATLPPLGPVCALRAGWVRGKHTARVGMARVRAQTPDDRQADWIMGPA